MAPPDSPDSGSPPRLPVRHRQVGPVAPVRSTRRLTQIRATHTRPTQAESPVRHNLPAELSSLVGRERDLAALRPLLESNDTRLLTLTGPGGAGKTRLGLRLGSLVAETFPDGVWLVE